MKSNKFWKQVCQTLNYGLKCIYWESITSFRLVSSVGIFYVFEELISYWDKRYILTIDNSFACYKSKNCIMWSRPHLVQQFARKTPRTHVLLTLNSYAYSTKTIKANSAKRRCTGTRGSLQLSWLRGVTWDVLNLSCQGGTAIDWNVACGS